MNTSPTASSAVLPTPLTPTEVYILEAASPIALPAHRSPTRVVLTSLTFWIVVGTIVGVVVGEYAPAFAKDAAPMAQLFLRPVQFVVFPLVFSSLVVGIAGQRDLKQLGRLSLKSFIYFEIVTTFALVLGLLAVNLIKPGEGSSITKNGEYKPSTTASAFTFAAWINHVAPKTWGEMMGGAGASELLQVLVASILVGVSTAQLHGDAKHRIVAFSRAVMEMMFKFVDIIIWTAPVGVCFAVANAIGTNGLVALHSLGVLVATVYGTLGIFMIVVFGPVMLLFRINPITFVVAMRDPLVIAYTTATSEAALPKVFEALDAYGVSPHISSFVVPFGYSFNLDGSTLYLSLASVFCAQAAGVSQTIGEQLVMVLMLMVSSKGVAGVRSASIIVLASTLEQFDIPSWPVALILGADWFMDMARTFTNVLGNCLAAVVLAKLEHAFRTAEWAYDREQRRHQEEQEDQYQQEDDYVIGKGSLTPKHRASASRRLSML